MALETQRKLNPVVEGNNDFALALYRQLKGQPGNVFFSPFSISMALAMVYAGARNETASQLKEALQFHVDPHQLHERFCKLLSDLRGVTKRGGIELRVANSLWPQDSYPLLRDYVSLLRQHYGVDISPVDFQSSPAEACRVINEWIDRKTRGKIGGLMNPDGLDPLTRLILVNAIYFLGKWETPFDSELTTEQPFYAERDREVSAQMMSRTGYYDYSRHDNFQLLRIHYRGCDVSMVILLPVERDGLSKLEESVTADELRSWIRKSGEQEVRAHLPRFKIDSTFELNDYLSSLGVIDLFDGDTADLSGMDGRGVKQADHLFLNTGLHRAVVEVDEQGTEAAAVTWMGMCGSSELPPPPPPIFRADHPFLFLIRREATDSILFMGRIVDPTME